MSETSSLTPLQQSLNDLIGSENHEDALLRQTNNIDRFTSPSTSSSSPSSSPSSPSSPSSFSSSFTSNFKCQSDPSIVKGAPVSACGLDHAAALEGLFRGVFSERSNAYTVITNHDTSCLTSTFSFLIIVIIARYILNRIIYTPYKEKVSKRKAEEGIVELNVTITKEMKMLNMKHNIVSPYPQSQSDIIECTSVRSSDDADDDVLQNKIDRNNNYKQGNSSDIFDISALGTNPSSINASSINASSISMTDENDRNSSYYNHHTGLKSRSPLSPGNVNSTKK